VSGLRGWRSGIFNAETQRRREIQRRRRDIFVESPTNKCFKLRQERNMTPRRGWRFIWIWKLQRFRPTELFQRDDLDGNGDGTSAFMANASSCGRCATADSGRALSRRNQTCLGEATAKTDEGGSEDGSVSKCANTTKPRTDPFITPSRSRFQTILRSTGSLRARSATR